ncbi:Chemokine XC receptor 1 [Halotydeus destructor]|nr:Chemokine XC receptor 1 [Halotydeus destructor]
MLLWGYELSEWSSLVTYPLLSLFAMIGNSVILAVILEGKKISNTYKLIINQCVADTVCGFVYHPLWIVCSSWAVSLGNGTGATICDLFNLVQVGTFFVSAYNMAVIAMDRYLKLYYPMSDGLKASTYVPMTWVFGMLSAAINSFHFSVGEFFTPYRLIGCRKSFPVKIEFLEKRYNYLFVFVFTNGCLSLVAFAYYKVVMKIRQRQTVGKVSQEKSTQRDEAKMRTTYMLITTAVAYIVLCGPLFSAFAIDYYIYKLLPECSAAAVLPSWFMFVYFCAVSSTAVNPVIFCYFNLEIRKQFKKVVKRLFGLESRSHKPLAQDRSNSFFFHSTTNVNSITM